MRWLVAIALAVIGGTAAGQEAGRSAVDVAAAIDRGLAFLVEDALAWKEEYHCASCHHAAQVDHRRRQRLGGAGAGQEPLSSLVGAARRHS